MLQFRLTKKTHLTILKVWLCLTLAISLAGVASASTIGSITENKGSASITREAGEELVVSPAFIPDIELNDTAETGNGRIKIEFLDEAELSLTEHTKVYIDKVYYDPDPSKSKMAMRMALGTARFASGRSGASGGVRHASRTFSEQVTPQRHMLHMVAEAMLGADRVAKITGNGPRTAKLLPRIRRGGRCSDPSHLCRSLTRRV